MAALSEVAWVFLAIALVFYIVLALKSLLKLSVCSICAAVSASWLALLTLRTIGWFENDVLLALLMGMSVVGGYYLWERHAKKEYLLFRLPVLLTLSFLAWILVQLQFDFTIVIVVGAVWAVHGLLYAYRNSPGVKPRVDKIIACCSSW